MMRLASSPPRPTPASSISSMHTPPQIKTEPLSTPRASHTPSPLVSLKTESSPPSELNNRFRSVVKSYLPGRPDLTSDSPLPEPSSSFSTVPTSDTPTKTHIKQEDRSTPLTSTDNTSSGLDFDSSLVQPLGPAKPPHLTHLTDAEYRDRLAQVKVTRERLMPTMKKSLQLTQEWAAKRRKQEARRDGPWGHGANQKDEKLEAVSMSIDEVQNLLRGLSMEWDRLPADGGNLGSPKRKSHGSKFSKEAMDVTHVAAVNEEIEKAKGILARTQALVAAMRAS